jgi:hypothetical protein
VGVFLAAQFFVERVTEVVEDFAPTDANAPLLGARRRTAGPRHRTMRAVVDWSYGLLSEDEQLFFQALGIFTGGFAVEAAAAVTMGFFCFSVATIGTLAAWSRECDENDGLNGFGQKSLRHTQFPIVRDPSEPTSPALVRLASA